MLFPSLTINLSVSLALSQTALGASCTSPPAGALVVRYKSPGSGEFATISSAVNALPDDNSAQTIFVFPGTYIEQVRVTRLGPLTFIGYTMDDTSYLSNNVSLQFGLSAAAAGDDDASSTLSILKDDFKMYNVNVTNTFPGSPGGWSAVALSVDGNRAAFYACAFIGFQDTVLANQGTQVYLNGYIEGAVDFIFGQRGQAYFGGNTIAIKGPGSVTASGRSSNDNTSYVFNMNKIIFTPNAASDTAGAYFLGRPWRDFAKVIFKNTEIIAPLNTSYTTLWSIWQDSDPRTKHVFLADFNTTGIGISHASRPDFSFELNSREAATFSIASAVGDDYKNWVDASYILY